MSTPVCIANAGGDALGLADVTLPLLPARPIEHIYEPEPEPVRTKPRAPAPKPRAPAPKPGERTLFGEGSASVDAPRERIWTMVLDPQTLAAVVPGANGADKVSDTAFRAEVKPGIGPVRGVYRAAIDPFDLKQPESVALSGIVEGALGFGHGKGHLTLREESPGRTTLSYRYEATSGGRVASIGGRLVDGAARVIIGEFFDSLAAQAAGRRSGFLARLWRRLRGSRR